MQVKLNKWLQGVLHDNLSKGKIIEVQHYQRTLKCTVESVMVGTFPKDEDNINRGRAHAISSK